MPGATVQDWLTFIENRLSAWSGQLNALVALAGLLPAGILSAGLQVVTNPEYRTIAIIFVSTGLLLTFVGVVRLVTRRSLLKFIVELILANELKTPEEVADFYAYCFASGP